MVHDRAVGRGVGKRHIGHVVVGDRITGPCESVSVGVLLTDIIQYQRVGTGVGRGVGDIGVGGAPSHQQECPEGIGNGIIGRGIGQNRRVEPGIVTLVLLGKLHPGIEKIPPAVGGRHAVGRNLLGIIEVYRRP